MRKAIFLVINLLIVMTFIGCQQTSVIENYTQKVWSISIRGYLIENSAGKLFSEIDEEEKADQCAEFRERYIGFIRELASIDCPEKCVQLKDYMQDYLTVGSEYWGEFYLYYVIQDETHLDKSISLYSELEIARALMRGEMQRLAIKYDFNLMGNITVADE